MNTRRTLIILISVWLTLNALLAPPMKAQQPAVDQTRSAVTLDGQILFYVSNFKVYSSEIRARRIEGALKTLADDYAISPKDLTIVDDMSSTDIIAGDQILIWIIDADASAEGVSRQDLAMRLVGKISAAVERYRRDRAPRFILRASIYTLLATLVFIALILVFVRANRKFMVWLDARIRQVQVQSHELVQADWALRVVTGVWGPIRLIIACGLVVAYVEFVLSLFPWTRALAFEILEYLVVPLKVMANSIVPEIPSLLFIALLAAVTHYLLRLTRFLFSAIEGGRIVLRGFYPDWSQPTHNIVRVLVIACAFVVAFPYIPGSTSLAFQGVSVFLGVLLSLGSTSAVANIVAGILLTYMRAFKVGDVVTIGDSTGIVTAISMLVTHVRTFKKEEITIPNAMVLTTHVTNFSKASREDGLTLHTSVTISYETPWRQVEALLLMAAQRTSGLLHEPAPFVLQTALDDFYIRYELNVATSDPQRMRWAYSELHANIVDAFNEYRVQIMSPHYEADRKVPTLVPKEEWFASPAKAPPGKSDQPGRP